MLLQHTISPLPAAVAKFEVAAKRPSNRNIRSPCFPRGGFYLATKACNGD